MFMYFINYTTTATVKNTWLRRILLYYFDSIPIASHQALINCSITCLILGIPKLLGHRSRRCISSGSAAPEIRAAPFTPQGPCHWRSQLVRLTLAFALSAQTFFYGLPGLVSPQTRRRTKRQPLLLSVYVCCSEEYASVCASIPMATRHTVPKGW